MLAPYVIGPKHAKELLLTGNDKITADRCYQMGILNQVVADGKEMEAALNLQIKSSAPHRAQYRGPRLRSIVPMNWLKCELPCVKHWKLTLKLNLMNHPNVANSIELKRAGPKGRVDLARPKRAG